MKKRIARKNNITHFTGKDLYMTSRKCKSKTFKNKKVYSRKEKYKGRLDY